MDSTASMGSASGGAAGVLTDAGGGTGEPARADGGAPSFRVAITASASTVCPGQCAQLTAAVLGGSPPYRFAWEHDARSTAQLSVCPTATTSYVVTVRDSSVQDEFSSANPPVSASTRIAVAPADACEGGELVDAGVPELPSREVCSLRAPVQGGGIVMDAAQKGHASLIDSAGHLVVAGTFSGTLEVDGEVLVAGGSTDGFLMKLDTDCRVLWARHLREDQEGELWVSAVASDDEANLFVVGGEHGTTSTGDGYGGFVMKLEPVSGNVRWRKTYTSVNATAAVAVTDVVVDAQDRVTLLGYGSADTDLGGGTLGFWYAGSIPFLAQLGTDGSFGFSRTFTSGDLLYGLANAPHDDGVIVTGWAVNNVSFGNSTLWLGTGGRYLAKLDALGSEQWLRALPRGADADQWNWWKGGVVVDTHGNIVVLRDEPQTLPGDTGARVLDDSVEKYSTSGEPLWQTRLSEATSFDAPFGSALAPLPDRHLLRFGTFTGTTDYAGQTVVSRGYSDVALVELSADGEPVSVYTTGTPLDDRALSVVSDADGNIFTTHVTITAEPGDEQELVVTRLARD